MVQGQASLNVKDYPFALSLAALIFPSFLAVEQGVEQTSQSITNLSSFLAITIFGGVLGSLLTITNPGGHLLKWIYRRFAKDISKETFNITQQDNPFVFGVTKTNYYASLSSPSISYEIDKIVGIFYFVILLIITLYKLLNGDLEKSLHLNTLQLCIAQILVVCALAGTIIIATVNIRGINKKFVRSLSLYTKIKAVSILLTARDLINLELDANKFKKRKFHGRKDIAVPFLKCLLDSNINKISQDQLQTIRSFADLRDYFQRINMDMSVERIKNDIISLQTDLEQIRKKYGLEMNDMCFWLNTVSETKYHSLDDLLSQLQSSVESRDWHNSDLITIRTNHSLIDLFATREWEVISLD